MSCSKRIRSISRPVLNSNTSHIRNSLKTHSFTAKSFQDIVFQRTFLIKILNFMKFYEVIELSKTCQFFHCFFTNEKGKDKSCLCIVEFLYNNLHINFLLKFNDS